MTYAERLAGVNSRIRTTSIKGKEYAEVNQRVLAFWELFPEGRIRTEVLEDTGTRCTVRAQVWRSPEEEWPAATGTAFEERKGSINSTSYLENCETSAVGRALGMLGIGATEALASAEEVAGAIAQQEATRARERPSKAKGEPEGEPEGEEARKGPQGARERPAYLNPVRQRLEPFARRTGRTTKQVVEELQRMFGDLSALPPAMVPEVCAWLDQEGV